jgi:uncharacterized protein (DUF39 family)
MDNLDRKFDAYTINQDGQLMLAKAARDQVETVWDRHQAQQPQCGFCEMGLSCRICIMGPCRIDPFGEGPQRGVCGADADIIVARNLGRMIAAGAASHSDHGRDLVEVLAKVAEGKAEGYAIKDPVKLRSVASEFGIAVDGKDDLALAGELADAMQDDYGTKKASLTLLARAPEKRRAIWDKLGITPRGIDRETSEMMHRTHMGVDNDWVSLLLHGMRNALSDGWGGSMIATEVSDILFGTPQPAKSSVNMGVLKEDQVNIIVHGHNPVVSETIVAACQSPELLKLAQESNCVGLAIGFESLSGDNLKKIGKGFNKPEMSTCLDLCHDGVQATAECVKCHTRKNVPESHKAKNWLQVHAEAAKTVDVVTTATFGPMCSSGCFINFGHSKPRIRITEAWLDDVSVYCGIGAVDVYLGATQLRHNDPANMYYPGDFHFGGGHVIEKLVAGEKIQLFGLSYGTDDYPRKEIRTWFTIHDLNQAIMVNPRNSYQNYNVAINCSDKTIYTYLGILKPQMKNATYCSAGQLSPLLNDPYCETIGIGTKVWLAGAQGHVYSEGTQYTTECEREPNGVPVEGAGTLAVTADMKKMQARYVRGISLKGYGVSLALGLGIPIPVLNEQILKYTTVRDRDIFASVIDYSSDYPQRTGKVLAKVNYEQLRSGEITINQQKDAVGTLSSYKLALEIAELLKEEIARGEFMLSKPLAPLPRKQSFKSLQIKGNEHNA